MKREARILLEKSIDSLVLSVEHFNRPWDRGRPEATLIFLDRAFELCLKAAILHKGGKIREAGDSNTIGFDKCVRKCISEEKLKVLIETEAITPQLINSLRDAAQHYVLEISERQLYLCAKAGVTLFGDILGRVFNAKLSDFLPERVMPISTLPPVPLDVMMDSEFKTIKELIGPRSRKGLQAKAKLRTLATIEASLKGQRVQPSDNELKSQLSKIRRESDWKRIFPGIASLTLETDDKGLALHVRISKTKGEPVRLVPEGTPGATVVAVKRVDELGFYSLGLSNVAKHFPEVTQPKLLAVIRHLQIQNDPEYFKLIAIGSQKHKRYSQKVIEKLKAELPKLDVEKVWKAGGS